jgi:hypothetical protein
MIPDADVFGNCIDFSAIAITVKNKRENIVSSLTLPREFATHNMRRFSLESQGEKNYKYE